MGLLFPVRHGCICCVASCEGLRGSSPPMVSVPVLRIYHHCSFVCLSRIFFETIQVGRHCYCKWTPSSRSNSLFFRVGTLHGSHLSSLKPCQCCFHGLLGFTCSSPVRRWAYFFCFDVFMHGYTSFIRFNQAPIWVVRCTTCCTSAV